MSMQMQMSSKVHQQFASNSTQFDLSPQNEEKRVSFIEIPISSTNGPDPPFMESEILNLMK